MIQEIADALLQSWRNFASAFVLFVPRLVAATIIFAGGLIIALLVRRAIQRLLLWIRFDQLSARSGASELLRAAEMPAPENLIGQLVFWIVWIGFIMSATVILTAGVTREGRAIVPHGPGWQWFVPVGLLNGLSVLLMYAALARGPVTLVAPLVACYPLATLAFGRLLLGAGSLTWTVALGVATTVAGVALLLRA